VSSRDIKRLFFKSEPFFSTVNYLADNFGVSKSTFYNKSFFNNLKCLCTKHNKSMMRGYKDMPYVGYDLNTGESSYISEMVTVNEKGFR